MRTILAILANLILVTTFGQATLTENCYSTVKPSSARQTYPFNKADRILLVRYKAVAVQGNPNYFSWDTPQIIPKAGKDIDTTKLLSKYQLSENGIDSLLKIVNLTSKGNIDPEGVFVEPSNAVLFLNKKGHVFEYIVICFAQVGQLKNYTAMASSPKLNLGGWCREKGRLLIDFFHRRGVEAVVTKWE